MERIVILGGGTAEWMTAAALSPAGALATKSRFVESSDDSRSILSTLGRPDRFDPARYVRHRRPLSEGCAVRRTEVRLCDSEHDPATGLIATPTSKRSNPIHAVFGHAIGGVENALALHNHATIGWGDWLWQPRRTMPGPEMPAEHGGRVIAADGYNPPADVIAHASPTASADDTALAQLIGTP